MDRRNIFVIHSWDEADVYARMKNLLSRDDSGLADYSVPPWKAVDGDDEEVMNSIESRIRVASAVVVLNTPQLHKRPWSTFEMERAVAMNKRIIVLQPHGEFNRPIPQVLDGGIYRVSPWRGDVLGRSIRGEYPYDDRVFAIAEVEDRRSLADSISALVGVGSFILAGVTLANMKALSDELAPKGIQLEWTEGNTAQVAVPTIIGAVAAGAIVGLITRDPRAAAVAALAGAGAGAAIGLHAVYRARVVGTRELRVCIIEPG